MDECLARGGGGLKWRGCAKDRCGEQQQTEQRKDTFQDGTDASVSGLVTRHGGGVEHLPVIIEHAHFQFVGLQRDRDKTGATAFGELGVRGVLGFPHRGTGAGTEEIDFTGLQMLQVVVMAVEVSLHLIFFEQREDVLDDVGRVAVDATGINRVMRDDDLPRRVRSGKCGLEPDDLFLARLAMFAGVGRWNGDAA